MSQILVDEAGKKFLLRAGNGAYGIGVNAMNKLCSLHWGAFVERVEDLPDCSEVEYYQGRHTRRAAMDFQEYPAWGGEFYNEPALKVNFGRGVRTSILDYKSYSTGACDGGEELVITLGDYAYPLTVNLHYLVYPDSPVMVRWVDVINDGEDLVILESVQSACFHPPRRSNEYRLSHLTGRWAGECMIRRQAVTQGKIVLENRTGLSSSFEHPYFALDEGGACEAEGRVWFGTLLYNGNWKIAVECNAYEQTCVTGGISDFDFSWPLKAGESFTAPKFIFAMSEAGFGGASRMLHDFQRSHIAPEVEVRRVMPVLFNSWSSMEINVNEEKILESAQKAADIGAELFVIDDGWQSALGDWRVDKVKFPNGLKPVVEKLKTLGVDLGLWVEVESFEVKSELYQNHPEWAMNFPGREPYRHYRADVDRTSLLLNFARNDVAQYMLETLRSLVAQTGIKYLKLDMNYYFTDPGWGEVDELEQRTIWVKYARNVYGVFQELKKEFPDLLIENCAAGGGRGDLLMDGVFGRINRSDNQDTLDVLRFHEGFTWLHPSKMAGGACHISDSIRGMNKRVTPLQMQAFAGIMGSLSVGKDLLSCPQETLEEIREYISLYKRLRSVAHEGDLYRLASLSDTPYTAFEFVLKDKSEALLFAFSHGIEFCYKVPNFKVGGLDAGGVYDIECYGDDERKLPGYLKAEKEIKPLSGRALAEIGLSVRLSGDYDCKIVHFKKRS